MHSPTFGYLVYLIERMGSAFNSMDVEWEVAIKADPMPRILVRVFSPPRSKWGMTLVPHWESEEHARRTIDTAIVHLKRSIRG